ncbi:MAG: hypothetical protein JST30_16000 [Armatimonadetes bacterium]|nr:hypothetical protein [Armatimonadota bacterium]
MSWFKVEGYLVGMFASLVIAGLLADPPQQSTRRYDRDAQPLLIRPLTTGIAGGLSASANTKVSLTGLTQSQWKALTDGSVRNRAIVEPGKSVKATVDYKQPVSAKGIEFFLAGGALNYSLTLRAADGTTKVITRSANPADKLHLFPAMVVQHLELTLSVPRGSSQVRIQDIQLQKTLKPVSLELKFDANGSQSDSTPGMMHRSSVNATFTVADFTYSERVDPTACTMRVLEGPGRVDRWNNVVATGAGKITVEAEFAEATVRKTIQVRTPVLEDETFVDPVLAKPMAGCKWEIPVVAVLVIPTSDGKTVRAGKSAMEDLKGLPSIENAKQLGLRQLRTAKYMMEEASRFRGYKNPGAPPSLGFKCLEVRVVYEDLPTIRNPFLSEDLRDVPYYDYGRMVSRVDGVAQVEERGAKQFWFFSPFVDGVTLSESRAYSPTTYPIEVSNGFDVMWEILPLKKHYIVYHFNLGQYMSLHTVGHQYESMFDYFAKRQEGVHDMFVKQFVGPDGRNRVGSCHWPPNAAKEYDYYNATPRMSDIEDWRPEGGPQKPISCKTWESIPYRTPEGESLKTPQSVWQSDGNYYVYWMQNMPGLDNGIPYKGGTMSNWWYIVADFEAALKSGYGLTVP